jgi:cytochrome c2
MRRLRLTRGRACQNPASFFERWLAQVNFALLLRLLDHALIAALVLALSGAALDRPLWQANPVALAVSLLFSGACAIAGFALEIAARRRGRLPWHGAGTVALAAFGAAFALLTLAQGRVGGPAAEGTARVIALIAVAAGVPALIILNWLHGALERRRGALLVPAVIAATVVAAYPVARWYSASGAGDATAGPAQEISHLDTSLYVLKATTYRRSLPGAAERGGAIAPLGSGYLVAAGNGALYFATESEDRKTLSAHKLAAAVPFNPEAFLDGARRVFGSTWKGEHHLEKLRVADLLVQELPAGRARVVVSHHWWNPEGACTTVRVSVFEASRGELIESARSVMWRTLYESSPCLSLNAGGHRGARFGGIQIGGAMALLSEDELLLAVGDHEFDGWNRVPAFPQQADGSYGKVIRIRLDTGDAETWSVGHRNPQGLLVDPRGAVWETEHGPRGGDELNRVERGGNYGWPFATYGTEYRLHKWPLEGDPALGPRFEAPVLAFVPSIALSALVRIDGDRFPAWRGNFLLASLSGQLRRVVFQDGRPVVIEPFAIPGRARDVAQGRDGRIALWTDEQDLVLIEPAASGTAEELVFQCTGCHTLSSWERASIGPNLWRVMGRHVAGDDDFSYSEAMAAYGGRWNRERLDRFLADPAAAVPGNTMQFGGIDDPLARQKLIDYLEQLR